MPVRAGQGRTGALPGAAAELSDDVARVPSTVRGLRRKHAMTDVPYREPFVLRRSGDSWLAVAYSSTRRTAEDDTREAYQGTDQGTPLARWIS